MIKGTLILVPGDNLASHYLEGYKLPSGALQKCRFCMATYNEMSEKVCLFVNKNTYVVIYSFYLKIIIPELEKLTLVIVHLFPLLQMKLTKQMLPHMVYVMTSF